MNKTLIRYLLIILAGLLLSFIAKMEMINFVLAVSVGVLVTIFAYQYQAKAEKNWSEREGDRLSLPWLLAFAIGLFLELYIWPIYFLLPVAAGFLSGYLVYSALNALFIS